MSRSLSVCRDVNPKMHNSKFLQFVSKLSRGELMFEDNKVREPSWEAAGEGGSTGASNPLFSCLAPRPCLRGSTGAILSLLQFVSALSYFVSALRPVLPNTAALILTLSAVTRWLRRLEAAPSVPAGPTSSGAAPPPPPAGLMSSPSTRRPRRRDNPLNPTSSSSRRGGGLGNGRTTSLAGCSNGSKRAGGRRTGRGTLPAVFSWGRGPRRRRQRRP